jgi:hypothetical protein
VRDGYPTFSQSLLPLDADLLDRLFGADVGSQFLDLDRNLSFPRLLCGHRLLSALRF